MNTRFHGDAPYKIITVHGGPGGAGQLNVFSSELSKYCGVIEALQTKYSIPEQIEELKQQITDNCNEPIAVIGHSWGAWLSMMLATKYPELIQKLILIGCGALQEEYRGNQEDLRLSRLSCNQRVKYESIIKRISSEPEQASSKDFVNLAKLATLADSYSLLEEDNNTIFNFKLFNSIWPKAAGLRRSGELINMISRIQCPITIIHGTYDSHIITGVTKPLDSVGKEYKLIELEKCGHYPWREEFAKDEFFHHLCKELSS